MEDVFNNENESFMQETRLIESEYSVNLPTRFYYRKRWNNGWINVVNPFRASIVLGTPGSGKSYAVVNNFIKQQIEKGFSQYIYDFKYPDLSTIAYNHLLNQVMVREMIFISSDAILAMIGSLSISPHASSTSEPISILSCSPEGLHVVN